MPFPFLPMFPDEVRQKGWSEVDVLIVTGDAYVDHPAYGMAVIGRVLEAAGYKVGIISQPDWNTLSDFTRLGRPRICACVTAGNVDSMIANYTANKRRRTDLHEGKHGFYGKRPDRAAIVYTNRLRAAFKGLPIILGGTEASMRRLAHYDYWDDAVRRSVLIDSKADLLIYGMGEYQIVEVINRLKKGESVDSIRDVSGTVVRVKETDIPAGALLVPAFEEIRDNKELFNKAFRVEYNEMNPFGGRPIVQPHADQLVMQLPPAKPLTTARLDATYALPYVRATHPFYNQFGGVWGFETVRWSIVAVRGCVGECSFCGLYMNQGRIVQSRSEASILAEAEMLARHPDFKGTITDIGGPTANLYGAQCRKWETTGPCSQRQCLMPGKCPSLSVPYARTLALYEKIRRIPKVKHVFVSSGLRYDLLLDPEAEKYLRALCEHYVSGQMKVAPEHTEDKVLAVMNKPPYSRYEAFVKKFEQINSRLKKRKYLVNYFISSHPGCNLGSAKACAKKLSLRHMRPEQIQDFLPLPMTVSGCMFWTGIHPLTGERVYVPKSHEERAIQRALFQPQNAKSRAFVRRAARPAGQKR